jgi:hypothetical protein
VLPLVVALGAVGMMVMASAANAAHPRPQGATPLRASMVPSYRPCTAPNRNHGPPLGFPSCNPPVQQSTAVTVGEVTANGAPAQSTGFIRLSVLVGTPGAPDDSDVIIVANITDVRCRPGGTTACTGTNTAGPPDYTGSVQGNATIRITDHWNAVAPGGGPDAATVVDIPFPVNAGCSATGPGIGATCAVTTSANTVVPTSVKDGKRAIVEVGQLQVFDGGPDGDSTTAPNTLFEVQGIFIP